MINITDNKYKKSYKELSYDKTNKDYLIDIDDKFAIDFDDVAIEFGNVYNVDTLKSCDALICNSDNNYKFIEFKNGKYRDSAIRDKLYFSIFMLSVVEHKKVLEMEIVFELVYNLVSLFGEKEVRLDDKRRALRDIRQIQSYNSAYAKHSNEIVTMRAIDNVAFEERERKII